jgi:hypothetical protein
MAASTRSSARPINFLQSIDEYTSWTHDCSTDHQGWPGLGGEDPEFYSYDAFVLKAEAMRIAQDTLDPSNNPLQFLRYELLSEYLLANFSAEINLNDQYRSIRAWAIALDLYFFSGSLMKDDDQLITLRLSAHNYSTWKGKTEHSIVSPNRRIVINLRDPDSGKRYSRAQLFDTLLQQMSHAYVKLFFNRCPRNHDNEYEYDRNNGHGALWVTVYQLACHAVCRWQPDLAFMGADIKDLERVEVNLDPTPHADHAYWGRTLDVLIKKYYISLMGRLLWLKGQWSGSVVNRRTFATIFPYRWTLQSGPAGKFENALLLMTYENYESFVRSRVPYPTVAKKILCVVSPLLLCLILGCAWYFGQLENLLLFFWHSRPSVPF